MVEDLGDVSLQLKSGTLDDAEAGRLLMKVIEAVRPMHAHAEAQLVPGELCLGRPFDESLYLWESARAITIAMSVRMTGVDGCA